MPLLHRAARSTAEPGRNDPCPCGSGRKFKQCCAGKTVAAAATAVRAESVGPDGPEKDHQRIRSLRDAGRFLEAARLAKREVERHPHDATAHSELGLVHLYAGRTAEALPSLLQAVRLDPGVAEFHNNAGFALEQLGRDGEAITAFKRAVALDPLYAQALERLGILLMRHDHRVEAVEFFRRAADAAPDTPLAAINRAKVLFEEGRNAEGQACLREAVTRFPEHADTKRFLANLLREAGRFDEAIPLLEEATEGSPFVAAIAYYDLAMSKRISNDDQPMLDQMQALLNYRPLPQTGRQNLHFGLGKAMDDLGDHAAAMRHFDAANRIVAEKTPFDRSHFGASVQRLINSATAEFLQDHAGQGSVSELPVLILGMPRSGTTLVEQIVSSHPEVVGGDELTFWTHAAHDFGRLSEAEMTPAWFARVAADYETVLRGIGPTASRVTDKAPGNFLWIGLFHLAFPRGRIIHCRRDPIDTCLSNYFANFASPTVFAYDKGDLAFYYRWYRRLIQHWRSVLPPGAMLEVDYEQLVAEPEDVTRQMVDFLGLEWNDACLRPQDNQRAVKTASMWQARQPTYRTSTERWRRYEPWLGELRGLLDDPDGSGQAQPVSENLQIPVARRLRDAGRHDEALSTLTEALRKSPNDPVLYCDTGSMCLLTGQVELAVDCFERAIGLCPQFATAHYNLGAAMERQGRPQEAMAALRQAIALVPTGPAYSRLGNLLQAAGEREAAMECFRRAAELLERPTEREFEEAKLLLAEGRPTEAEPLLRRVVADDPNNSLAHAVLGDVLGEAGRFAEAVAMLRQATELDPNRVGAWHNLTILTKVTDADRPLVTRMTELLEQPGRTDFDRALLHFALGKAHDDVGEYAEAMRHYDEANAIERRRLTFDQGEFAERIDRLIETFTPAAVANAAASGSELPICIIGMPRSGTTLVEQIVSAHRSVGAGGELTFWSDRGDEKLPSAALAGEYTALLRRIAPDAARVTDKNPFNFLWAGHIHQALPNARFIHCRRDPIDTCLSIYFTRFATPQPFAYDRGDLVFYFREYQRLMAHWRTVLPADRLLEIDYEALTADPEPLTRRMIEFCGLDWDPSCLAPERNQRVVRTASLWQARQPVYRSSVQRWRRYEPWLGALRDLLAGES